MSSSSEDQGRLLHDFASCSTLASKSMVFRDDSAYLGSPVSATPGEPIPQQLEETLNNARALYTCANYDIKWIFFFRMVFGHKC